MRHKTAHAYMYGYATHIKPQGYTSRPPLLTTNKVLSSLYKTTSLPRLVTAAKVPDMAAQLQGMFGTPWGFVSAKIKFLTVGSRRNGHPQI